MIRNRPLAAIALLCVAGCSTPPGNGATGSDTPGLIRRVATVVQVGDAASFGPLRDNDCRSTAAPERLAAQTFASVQYFSGRHAHLRIVPVADDFEVTGGDQVFVKTGVCDDALSR